VEAGPEAILAVVIRGAPQENLRRILQDTLEEIHLNRADLLEEFQGDTGPLEALRPDLERCMMAKEEEEEEGRKTSPVLWFIGVVLIGLLAWWLIGGWLRDREYRTFVSTLDEVPGLLVTQYEISGGDLALRGLRDPDAPDPLVLAEEAGIDPLRVQGSWETTLFFEPTLVLARVTRLLPTPSGVVMEYEGDTLTFSGVAPDEWIRDANTLLPALTGGQSWSLDRVLSMEQIQEVGDAQAGLEELTILFATGSSLLTPSAQADLSEAVVLLNRIIAAARELGMEAQFVVEGAADPSGEATRNAALSEDRARTVVEALVAAGIPGDLLSIQALGALPAVGGEEAPEMRRELRRVKIRPLIPGLPPDNGGER
jgi:outer membrane protein OmpA-like peptidoglycan-associated protein